MTPQDAARKCVYLDSICNVKGGGTVARGECTSEGFVVLKGSQGREYISKGFEGYSFAKHRSELLAQGKIAIKNGSAVFNEDVLFLSPSGASGVVCGAASNGWREWKNIHGVTLHELKRGEGAGLLAE